MGHYTERREPKDSKNPIVCILDFLCQRCGPYEAHTYFVYVASYGFSFNLLLGYWWFGKHGIDTGWVFYLPLIPLLFIDNLYRYYRNKYLKKHNLPGPYGYGTIDDFPVYVKDEKDEDDK